MDLLFTVQMDSDAKHMAKATQEFRMGKKFDIFQW